MFESYDFDDDIELGSSFPPTSTTSSSIQSFRAPKRPSQESEKEVSKKYKTEECVSTALHTSRIESIPLKGCVSRETFVSPNRVVKRKFPGPAGLLPDIGVNKSILQLLEDEKGDNDGNMPLLSQQTNSIFEDGPWNEMSKDLYVYNGENLLEQFNIKWIKKHAFKQLLNYKAPFLAALVQNIDIVDGRIPTINVTLKDTTGEIRGTILYSLYEEYSPYFKTGSVLVLKQFGVLSASYNNHCVTITPNNLISIYYVEGPCKFISHNTENHYEGGDSTVKKVVVQNFKYEEIMEKYNEDIKVYFEEKQKKINFGNLYRNSSDDFALPGPNERYNVSAGSKLIRPFIEGVPASKNESLSMNTSTNKFSNVNTATRNDSPVKKFNFKGYSGPVNKTITSNKNIHTNNDVKDVKDKDCDNVIISCSQISIKPDNKEHTEIWKNLLEDIDTEALFDDF